VGIFLGLSRVELWPAGSGHKPSTAQVNADLAAMKPVAVMAATTQATPMGQFLVGVFGPPTTHIGQVLGWRLTPGQQAR